MANVIELAQIFQSELDEQVVAGSTSGWMEANTDGLIYNGGNTVKIPKISTAALADYDRGKGFTNGPVDLSFETRTMSQDRARSFTLDSMDVNESNFVANATNVMGQFQRTKVIPEIDVYRYSTIASIALENGRASGGYTPTAADVLSKLRADIAAVQDEVGAIPLVVTMSIATLSILESSTELSKFLQVTQFPTGSNVSLEVKSIDECPIIEVPSARLKTAYVFNDGVTAGQEDGGFTPAATAKTINWIVCAQTTPIAVSKTDTMRIFTPEQNINADAWKIDYRKYHDLWIADNKYPTLFVNVKEALA